MVRSEVNCKVVPLKKQDLRFPTWLLPVVLSEISILRITTDRDQQFPVVIRDAAGLMSLPAPRSVPLVQARRSKPEVRGPPDPSKGSTENAAEMHRNGPEVYRIH